VQDGGKYASRCGAKPQGGLCAVLPQVKRFFEGLVSPVGSVGAKDTSKTVLRKFPRKSIQNPESSPPTSLEKGQ